MLGTFIKANNWEEAKEKAKRNECEWEDYSSMIDFDEYHGWVVPAKDIPESKKIKLS